MRTRSPGRNVSSASCMIATIWPLSSLTVTSTPRLRGDALLGGLARDAADDRARDRGERGAAAVADRAAGDAAGDRAGRRRRCRCACLRASLRARFRRSPCAPSARGAPARANRSRRPARARRSPSAPSPARPRPRAIFVYLIVPSLHSPGARAEALTGSARAISSRVKRWFCPPRWRYLDRARAAKRACRSSPSPCPPRSRRAAPPGTRRRSPSDRRSRQP